MVALAALALGLVAARDTLAQNAQRQFVVRDAKVPAYPPIARAAHVVGTVTVDVHVEKGAVVKATPRSGPPLLVGETVRNIQTWTFSPGTTGELTSAFEFRISGEPVSSPDNPEIELRLPYKVTITVRPVEPVVTF